MNINPDNPKWTAYVLGELSEAERAELEKELESSAAAREIVDEIRMATALLKDEFAQEAAHGLAVEQRRAIGAAAADKVSRPWYTVRKSFAATAMAAAAILIIALISIPLLLPSRQAPNQTAMSVDRLRVQTLQQAEPDNAVRMAGQQGQQGGQAEQDQRRQKAQLDQQVQQGQQGQQGQSYRELPKDIPGLVAPGVPIAADRRDRSPFNTEAYDYISDNAFVRVTQDPLATFSIDVDTAAYANLRRFLTLNQLPPKDSVRIEEM